MIGTNRFGFYLQKKENNIEIKMIVNNINLMEYKYNNQIRTTTWDHLSIIDFFVDNLKYILQDDNYPFETNDRSGIQMSRDSGLKFDWHKIENGDNQEIEKLERSAELLDLWVQKHNWFYYRDCAYVPDVAFRKVNGKIEISWDNNDIFEDEILFTSLEGCEYIDLVEFEIVIKELIIQYRKIINE